MHDYFIRRGKRETVSTEIVREVVKLLRNQRKLTRIAIAQGYKKQEALRLPVLFLHATGRPTILQQQRVHLQMEAGPDISLLRIWP